MLIHLLTPGIPRIKQLFNNLFTSWLLFTEMISWRSYLIILHVHHNLLVNILVNTSFVSTTTLTSIRRDNNPVNSIHKDIIPVKMVRTCLILQKLFFQNYFSEIIFFQKLFFLKLFFQKLFFWKKFFSRKYFLEKYFYFGIIFYRSM